MLKETRTSWGGWVSRGRRGGGCEGEVGGCCEGDRLMGHQATAGPREQKQKQATGAGLGEGAQGSRTSMLLLLFFT